MKGEDILFSAIVGCCLLIIGCGVGVTIIIDDFRNAIVHSPRGVVIGLISQCLFMVLLFMKDEVFFFHNEPFCTYLMAVILDLPELQAAGLILVGCAPGGGTFQHAFITILCHNLGVCTRAERALAFYALERALLGKCAS